MNAVAQLICTLMAMNFAPTNDVGDWAMAPTNDVRDWAMAPTSLSSSDTLILEQNH